METNVHSEKRGIWFWTFELLKPCFRDFSRQPDRHKDI